MRKPYIDDLRILSFRVTFLSVFGFRLKVEYPLITKSTESILI